MKRAKAGFAEPHGFRDFEFVREGPDGAYWQAADGMVVRVAAAEHRRMNVRESEHSEPSLPEDSIAPRHSGA